MKKLLTLSTSVFAALSVCAQLPVSTTASKKNAILEEFTGIHCQYCPYGHKIAQQIMDANPGKFFPVNVHTGGYATPSGSEPDFRTTDGDAIAALPTMGITGYPTGDINRHIFTGSAMSESRSRWSGDVTTTIGQNSYVNLAGQATLDVTTNILTIDVEAYYTANSPQAVNKLTVMLLQDNINGPQTSGALYNPAQINPDGTYRHMHALRDVISATLGDSISTTTMGTTYTKQYIYTVPATIKNIPVDVANLKLVAFITETVTSNNSKETQTAAEFPISYTGIATTNNSAVASIVTEAQVCATSIVPTFNLKNKGSATMRSAVISYAVNGGTPSTYNWTGSLSPLATTAVTLPSLSYTLGSTNTISVTVDSVNSVVDEDNTDNNTTGTFSSTSATSSTLNVTVEFTQDQYGTECSWKMFDESGTLLSSDGPWSNLSASGILLHKKDVLLPSTGCYRFEMYDTYGDGINAGTGAGGIKIKNGYNTVIYSSNGQYGSKGYRNFTVTGTVNTTGIQENEVTSNVNVYPNPMTNNALVNFNLASSDNVSITVINALGQEMINENLGKRSAGEQTYSLNANSLNNGLYFLNIKIGNNTITKKVVVNK